MALKLYYFYWPDRGGRTRWLLEELGVPYEAQLLDYSKAEQRSDWYLKINPNGKVPALVDGNESIFETGAIFCHLVDKFPDRGLAPLVSSPSRKHFYQWMFYAGASLEPYKRQTEILSRVNDPDLTKAARELVQAKFDEVKQSLVLTLKSSKYLVDSRFSAADIMVGESLRYCRNAKLLNDSDTVLHGYLERLWDRPAFERVRSIGPNDIGG